MLAKKRNLTIEQGATFTENLRWKDSAKNGFDLSSYTARLQIRTDVDSATTILDLTSGGGEIVLGVKGTIDITVSSAVTTGLTPQNAVYDLELEALGVVTRLTEGKVTITPEVTR